MAGEIPPVVLTFGGGLNTRKRAADIDIGECTQGENFDLDLQNRAFRTRQPFDYVATADNAGEIRGYGQLIKQDGTLSTLIQAGTTVYEWDGSTTFTSVGTVNASAKLRGPKDHNYSLDDLLILTDLNKAEVVQSWDGTTFQDFAHNLAGVSLYAKYAKVNRERLWLANITTDATAVPHMVVGSQVESSTTLSTSNKPSSALGLDSPFYMLTPDLKPINGFEQGFGQMILSTEEGRLFAITGSNAFDFSIDEFYDGSAASGDEGLLNIGNDVAIGMNGRIESLSGTINFGDVEADDATRNIRTDVEDITAWVFVYDQRAQQVFAFPTNGGSVWVFHKALAGGELSPWSKWLTNHSFDFTPSTVFSIIDPITSLRTVFAGDATGNIWKLNGTGDQDGGSVDITARRRSKLIRIDASAELFDVDVWVDYRIATASEITMRFIWHGIEYGTTEVTFPLSAAAYDVYNGSTYYNGSGYYSSRFQTQIRRHEFTPGGRGNHLQVEAEFAGTAEIEEIGLHIKAAR